MKKNTLADFVICMAKEYEPFRKQIMERFSLSAAEVDVLMFIANNPEYNTAAQVSKIRMIPKSHVSLAVSLLFEKGLLAKSDSRKKSIQLFPTETASEIIDFGRKMQDDFQEALFSGFSAQEKAVYEFLHEKMRKNLENKSIKQLKEKEDENK